MYLLMHAQKQENVKSCPEQQTLRTIDKQLLNRQFVLTQTYLQRA
jgi:hypothetical protein